ncbi:kinase-like domain-containing protein [Crepidotus variabilis]|uniref:non-specific serine/threonine protein kinase n=1 Tax=Crepidotus variabilis TaxID=179855 RepID=A0A9P6EKW5_9AGAR|nr:kinase-like domain-containing protein [Crepidotus variabilis]
MNPPLSSLKLLESATLISQGAEAASISKVYRGSLSSEGVPVLLKYRFQKQYRHPKLDTSLTKSRVAGEARALLKCLRHGVNVPGIRMVDAPAGLLGIDWIDGITVKYLVPQGLDKQADETIDQLAEAKTLDQFGITIDALMNLIGVEIAKMHLADIIHGDLTTSNMILRSPQSTADKKNTELVVLIDFGLSYHSSLVEDKAVDLFVLERAFASTHPDFEPLFASVLAAYAKMLKKDWAPVQRRLDDVRLRGRKRSMVG